MKISPSKDVYAWIAIAFLCIGLFDAALLIASEGNAFLFAIVISALCLVIVLRLALTVAKTILLDPEGCTFSFLGCRKKFLWRDFSVKKAEDWKDVWSYRQTPVDGAIFTVKPHRRPKWLGPAEFCMWTAPFSSFFVCFHMGDKRFPNPYVVDKTQFLDLLSQWGVELDKS